MSPWIRPSAASEGLSRGPEGRGVILPRSNSPKPGFPVCGGHGTDDRRWCGPSGLVPWLQPCTPQCVWDASGRETRTPRSQDKQLKTNGSRGQERILAANLCDTWRRNRWAEGEAPSSASPSAEADCSRQRCLGEFIASHPRT